MLLTDTVGFINKLPTFLIAAFRATLEEIHEATVLVHVLDVTHPNAREHMATVTEVLEDLGADDKPVIVALNKVDRAGFAGVPSLDELMERLEIAGPSVRDLSPAGHRVRRAARRHCDGHRRGAGPADRAGPDSVRSR